MSDFVIGTGMGINTQMARRQAEQNAQAQAKKEACPDSQSAIITGGKVVRYCEQGANINCEESGLPQDVCQEFKRICETQPKNSSTALFRYEAENVSYIKPKTDSE